MILLVLGLLPVAVPQRPVPPTIEHYDGERVSMTSTVSVTCPDAGPFSVSFEAGRRGPAHAGAVVSNGRALDVTQRGKLDGWMAGLGDFDYARIGCASRTQAAVEAIFISGPVPKARSLVFVLDGATLAGPRTQDMPLP